MVKNKKGGSRHKKMGRKYVSNNFENVKLVKSSNEYEIYACVTKLLGNGMAEVLCNDEKTRLLIIRGKFSGRNKRDNQVNIGSVVLVGLREWSVSNKKKLPKVDLLYVYSKHQIKEIKNISKFNKKILPNKEDKIFFENNDNFENENFENENIEIDKIKTNDLHNDKLFSSKNNLIKKEDFNF
jgi:initiation factor 1A